MKISYYGHSCFAVEISDKMVLFDPFIRPNELARHVEVDRVKPDYILISHGHWDHLADAVEMAKKHNSTVVSILHLRPPTASLFGRRPPE